MTTRTSIAALAATAALGVAAPARAAGGTFACAANAISGTVLGQPLQQAAAGGAGACRTSEAGAALPDVLGAAPLLARTELAGDGGDVTSQKATSTAAVGDIRVGALDALTSAVAAPALPESLSGLPVKLPDLGLLGPVLPSLIKVDALDAVKALIPALDLPDVLHLGAVRSTATASCSSGKPVLDGSSQVGSLEVLGHDLGTDRAIAQGLTILPGSTLALDKLDLSLVKLPAGLSFADPLVGSVLNGAVRAALAALPPIEIPALLGDVRVSPLSQERDGTHLVQRALRVQVAAAGRQLLDLALAEASVDAAGVDCAKKVPVAPASQLAVECAKRPVTLVDVAKKPRHVALLGAVAKEHVGRSVSIVFAHTGKVVATAVVRPDGFFRARAPLPPKAIRHTNDARYQAVLDGHKSLALKLTRRMRISRMRNLGESVQIIGKIVGPLVPGQQIVIRRRESCTKDVVVKRFTPRTAGAWRVTLAAPDEGQAAVYRATTDVFGVEQAGKRFRTFTLPGYVSL